MADFSNCPDVRLAVLEDLPGLMDLMRKGFPEETPHEMDDERVLNMLRRYYDKQGAVLAVIGEVGKPEAYLLMVLDEIWYAKPGTMQLLELNLYVHPDHRKSDRAKQLMQFSKQASEGLELNLTIGVYSNARTEAKVRLYQRQFKSAGAFFVYKPASLGAAE